MHLSHQIGLAFLLSGAALADQTPACDGVGVEVMEAVSPKYPFHTEFEQGSVRVRVLIDAGGKTISTMVLEALPKGVFDAAAKRAVQQWRFNTSSQSERCAEYVVEFQLEP